MNLDRLLSWIAVAGAIATGLWLIRHS